jgi:hypothetical protein
MGKRDFYKKGDYNVICDRCEGKFKASECAKTWDNLFVCKYGCWETRQPQDFVRGRKDDQTVPIARVRGEPQYITDPITPEDL